MHLPCKRKPMPPGSSSFKCKCTAEMEAIPHLTGRKERPREIHHFILPGAQEQPVTDTTADLQCQLLSITSYASEDFRIDGRSSVSGPLHHTTCLRGIQDSANATVKPNPLKEHKISLFTVLTFPACCFPKQKAAATA